MQSNYTSHESWLLLRKIKATEVAGYNWTVLRRALELLLVYFTMFHYVIVTTLMSNVSNTPHRQSIVYGWSSRVYVGYVLRSYVVLTAAISLLVPVPEWYVGKGQRYITIATTTAHVFASDLITPRRWCVYSRRVWVVCWNYEGHFFSEYSNQCLIYFLQFTHFLWSINISVITTKQYFNFFTIPCTANGLVIQLPEGNCCLNNIFLRSH